MQILKPLDHKLSLSRHAHISQLLQPPSQPDIKAAASCFQITLDLCGFRAKPHQRGCCLNFCALCVGCRTQVSRAGQVLVLVQLFLRTWTAVKRAGSRTAPDLKGGSKADLAQGKKHRQVSWLRGGKSGERAQRTNKANGSLRLAQALWGRAQPRPRQGCFPRLGQTDGQGDDVNEWLKFACSFRLEMVPFAIVSTLFKTTVSMALSWRTKELICNCSVLGKASTAASSLN